MSKFRDVVPPHYTVVRDTDLCDLVNTVNRYIEHGYFPAGGICVVASQGSAYGDYYQAVFKPQAVPKPL